jgi:hypothetical protein
MLIDPFLAAVTLSSPLPRREFDINEGSVKYSNTASTRALSFPDKD